MKGLKQFLLRGNVVDMAVGIVIGAAFGTVVRLAGLIGTWPRLTPEDSGHMVLYNDQVDRKFRVNTSWRFR